SNEVDISVFLTDEEAKSIEYLPVEVVSSAGRYIILTVYRRHVSAAHFISALDKIVLDLSKLKSQIILLGDFNINLSCISREGTLLLNSLRSYNLEPRISIPTRVCHYRDESGQVTRTSATTIDNIFMENSQVSTNGVMQFDFSDHYIVFSILHKLSPVGNTAENRPKYYRRF